MVQKAVSMASRETELLSSKRSKNPSSMARDPSAVSKFHTNQPRRHFSMHPLKNLKHSSTFVGATFEQPSNVSADDDDNSA